MESQARKQVVRKTATERPIVVDPAIRLYYIEIEQATLEDPLGDWDRMARELNARFGLADLRLDPILLHSLQGILREGDRKVTCTVWQGREVVRVQPGYDEGAYGLAVDIGTTTIALHLCDLRTGAVLATTSQMNPQVAYGEDLMSRVSYCDTRPEGLATLHNAVIDALNRLALEAVEEAGITLDAITDAVLVGNSVMHHILLNIPPRELGQSPFAPAVTDAVDLKARDLGLQIAPGGPGARAARRGGPRGRRQCGSDPGRRAAACPCRRDLADHRRGHQRRALARQPRAGVLCLQPHRPGL